MAGVIPPPLPPHEFSAADRANEFCRALCDRLGIRPVETSREAEDTEFELGVRRENCGHF